MSYRTQILVIAEYIITLLIPSADPFEYYLLGYDRLEFMLRWIYFYSLFTECTLDNSWGSHTVRILTWIVHEHCTISINPKFSNGALRSLIGDASETRLILKGLTWEIQTLSQRHIVVEVCCRGRGKGQVGIWFLIISHKIHLVSWGSAK